MSRVRSKFDSGKVINRSPSGSWQYRYMGTGLQQNLGKSWEPNTWSEMTSTCINQVFIDVSNSASKIVKKYNSIKLPKKQETEKRKSKYAGKEDSQPTQARYDNGSCPDDIHCSRLGVS